MKVVPFFSAILACIFILSLHFDGLDILFINSALQYVDDYATVLRTLLSFRPRFVLLVRLAAGEFETFVTAQVNIPGSRIAYWFIDMREILSIFEKSGYRLLFKGAADPAYNQSKIPAHLRSGRMCNLHFARSDR